MKEVLDTPLRVDYDILSYSKRHTSLDLILPDTHELYVPKQLVVRLDPKSVSQQYRKQELRLVIGSDQFSTRMGKLQPGIALSLELYPYEQTTDAWLGIQIYDSNGVKYEAYIDDLVVVESTATQVVCEQEPVFRKVG